MLFLKWVSDGKEQAIWLCNDRIEKIHLRAYHKNCWRSYAKGIFPLAPSPLEIYQVAWFGFLSGKRQFLSCCLYSTLR